ncbi:helicase associated domain-containing protein [Streptomyces sp. 8N706]|uniref:helicase associated domain-containing protein n=1 Tax=Streptomyces sp. 8N706 TaxID=3457416 RepID=UPI003FD3E310
MSFNVIDTERQDWARGYAAARRYRERQAHLRVPYGHKEGAYPLGQWIAEQRRAYGAESSTRPCPADLRGPATCPQARGAWEVPQPPHLAALSESPHVLPQASRAWGSRGLIHEDRQARSEAVFGPRADGVSGSPNDLVCGSTRRRIPCERKS